MKLNPEKPYDDNQQMEIWPEGFSNEGHVYAALGVDPRHDGSGNLEGFSKILRDMTERKLAQEQLQEHADALQQADRRKDEFLAMLAHEIRNPLAPLRNGIDVLRVVPPNGEQAKQILDMMEEQASNLVRLIDDLLDVSRIIRGKMELRWQRVALSKIITNAIQTAQSLIHANGHDITVTEARENLYVHGDPTRLTQVVSNLLNNAARYTPRGGTILLTMEEVGDEVAIRVKDNGSGIASHMLPRIFEMLVQHSTTDKDEATATKQPQVANHTEEINPRCWRKSADRPACIVWRCPNSLTSKRTRTKWLPSPSLYHCADRNSEFTPPSETVVTICPWWTRKRSSGTTSISPKTCRSLSMPTIQNYRFCLRNPTTNARFRRFSIHRHMSAIRSMASSARLGKPVSSCICRCTNWNLPSTIPILNWSRTTGTGSGNGDSW